MLLRIIKSFPFLSYGIIVTILVYKIGSVVKVDYDSFLGVAFILMQFYGILGAELIFYLGSFFKIDFMINASDLLILFSSFFVLFLFDIILIMIKKMIKNLKINKKYLNRLH